MIPTYLKYSQENMDVDDTRNSPQSVTPQIFKTWRFSKHTKIILLLFHLKHPT